MSYFDSKDKAVKKFLVGKTIKSLTCKNREQLLSFTDGSALRFFTHMATARDNYRPISNINISAAICAYPVQADGRFSFDDNKFTDPNKMTIKDYVHKLINGKLCGYNGYTIGNGHKVYYFVTPMTKSGKFRCSPLDKGQPRYVDGKQLITIIRKKK